MRQTMQASRLIPKRFLKKFAKSADKPPRATPGRDASSCRFGRLGGGVRQPYRLLG
jgi:hypothetical protein